MHTSAFSTSWCTDRVALYGSTTVSDTLGEGTCSHSQAQKSCTQPRALAKEASVSCCSLAAVCSGEAADSLPGEPNFSICRICMATRQQLQTLCCTRCMPGSTWLQQQVTHHAEGEHDAVGVLLADLGDEQGAHAAACAAAE